MSNESFLRLSRRFFSNPLWQEDRSFSRAEAWLDCLRTAAWEEQRKIVEGKLVEVKRGGFVASVRYLSDRWKWSKTKVCSFLDLLECEKMITREKGQQITVVYLCKYDQYNPQKGHSEDTEKTPKGHSKDEIKEDLEDKEPPPPAAAPRGVKEGKASDLIPSTDQSRRFAAIFHRRLETPWTVKEVAAYKRLGKVPEDDLAAVEAYYAANWPPRRDVNILRHDLITFLNNFQGEVDRAHAAKTKPKTKRTHEWPDSRPKIEALPDPAEQERIREDALRLAREFREQQSNKERIA